METEHPSPGERPDTLEGPSLFLCSTHVLPSGQGARGAKGTYPPYTRGTQDSRVPCSNVPEPASRVWGRESSPSRGQSTPYEHTLRPGDSCWGLGVGLSRICGWGADSAWPVSFTYLNTRLCASLSTPVPDITHLGGGPEWR